MEFSALTDEQLRAALREAIQKYVDFVKSGAELPQEKLLQDSIIGKIIQENRRRKIK